MRPASLQGNASRISRQLWRRTKLATELIMRRSVDERTKGSSSRLNVKRLTSAAPKKASKSCGPNAAISSNSPISTASRRPIAPRDTAATSSDLRELAHPQQAYRRKKIKYDKCTARIGDADLEQECQECEQQPCRKPADQYFADLDPRLCTVRKFVVPAPAHSQDMDEARKQADGAMRQDIGHRIANR